MGEGLGFSKGCLSCEGGCVGRAWVRLMGGGWELFIFGGWLCCETWLSFFSV